jgi:CheY-like chemotaxis protein
LHILVVDDWPTTAESLALLLRLYGYQVTVALDGWTALCLAQADHPDVVLCDLNMPGMDGYEVARRLRRSFQDKVLLVAITAQGFEEDRWRCLQAGFDYHFTKPADPEQLEQLLQEWAVSL